MTKVTVNLDKALVDRVDRLARERAVKEDRPVSRTEIVSEAIEAHLKRQEKANDHQ